MISDHHTMTATTGDQWMMQLFQQSPDDDDHNLLQLSAMVEGLISDANTVVTTSSSSPSPTSPKAVDNGSRPMRRRSRASKRTPTTLLNANTNNFRALVQQFTGCPSSTAMSFEVYKGPITLNFKQGSRQVLHRRRHHNKSRTVTTVSSASAAAAAPFGNAGFSCEGGHHLRQYQQQLADQQQQWRLQDYQQQSVDDNLFDDNTDLFSSSLNSSSKPPSMEISDGLIVDHNYSLHDVTMNNASFFSNNDVIQNGTYYM